NTRPRRLQAGRWVHDAIDVDDLDASADSDSGESEDEDTIPSRNAHSRRLTAQPYEEAMPKHLHAWPQAQFVQPSSWERLVTCGRRLNDEVVNAGVSALAAEYPKRLSKLTALSSYEISQYKDGLGAEDLYQLVKRAQSWAQDVVVVPITKSDTHWVFTHWVLAVVWPKLGYIELFDSLGRGWWAERYAQVVLGYFRTATAFARSVSSKVKPLPGDWTYVAMVDRATQSNTYDCALCVLTTAVALCDGKRCTSLVEDDMPRALCT
ncbi:hypothetical protein AURDEDRAFT_177455, partial [Auricularia subglabra TFB-10046 SS5]